MNPQAPDVSSDPTPSIFAVALVEDPTSASGSHIPQLLDIAVVVPTYNERSNVEEFARRLEVALQGFAWELIFVDDDSPDGTSGLVREMARRDRRVRLIHRIGRRGLASACIEGILATTAQYIAVMDGDMQHDELILPQMLHTLRKDSLDLVVGTRNAAGGSMGDFGSSRVFLSKLGKRASQAVCRCDISDPMSGFFLVNRSFFAEVVHRLHGIGFKILVDMLSTSTRPVRFAEVGYTFRLRQHGESKLDVNTAIEYLLLVIEKLTDKFTGRTLPVRFVAFSLVGLTGAATNLVCVALLMFVFHWHFIAAQIVATYIAMTENFFLNNLVTWRDRSLRGFRLVTGLASFWVACSFGAWSNVLVARALLQYGAPWYLACVAGILLSSVWNYSMANLFTWQRPRPKHTATPPPETPIYSSDFSI